MRGGLSGSFGLQQPWLGGVGGRAGSVPEGLGGGVAVEQARVGDGGTRCGGVRERLGERVGAWKGRRALKKGFVLHLWCCRMVCVLSWWPTAARGSQVAPSLCIHPSAGFLSCQAGRKAGPEGL